eukprot:TRINITY_DN11152_c0_g1_i10.p4 TRINITY_DN11152_c0_g1~~TRINITY_DN11152_c0_g1_i10.p4  ORF type:complete len:170 (-),score=10.88 TRINITY_DN11152_c0_g1_i10:115-624(-)
MQGLAFVGARTFKTKSYKSDNRQYQAVQPGAAIYNCIKKFLKIQDELFVLGKQQQMLIEGLGVQFNWMDFRIAAMVVLPTSNASFPALLVPLAGGQYTSHSFRSGFATACTLINIQRGKIKDLGGWTCNSSTFANVCYFSTFTDTRSYDRRFWMDVNGLSEQGKSMELE